MAYVGSLFSLLSVARDGLAAQTAGLDTTGQNVTNASTPGYVRRAVVLQARPTNNGASGGVVVAGISRAFNRFTYSNVLGEQGQHGAAQARTDALTQVEAAVAPSSGTIGDRMNTFFASFESLAASPSDPSARAGVLASATSLAASISQTASDVSTARAGMLTQAQGIAGEVNDKLGRIAALNTQIADGQAEGGDTSDLRDQRDVLVRDVSDRIGASSIEDTAGRVTVFAAGTTLVDGDQAATVAVGTDTTGAMKFTAQSSGGSATDITSHVTAGSLAGLRQARDTDAANTATQLDQFAFDLSTRVNAVHSSGVGLDGTGGRNLFRAPTSVAGAAYAMAVDPSVAGQPDHIAAASAAAGLPGGSDVAAQLAGVGTQPLSATITGNAADRFGGIAGAIGTASAAASADLSMRDDTLAQADTLNQSSSGVSVDEEMVNMTKLQRAFEASTKVLQTADQLLDELMKELG